ncbi:MAG: hypothetical protein E7578_07585 [Ruminococcaceae bacterium]|nr:hypothetical protein [Oscillospiraceae bacterium]
MSTRDMILDVMNDVDPAFIKEHMDRATITGFRKFIRFAAPAMIYAAACIAAILILPHIIGKNPGKPPSDPAVIPGITEATKTTEPDDTDTPETTEDEVISADTEDSLFVYSENYMYGEISVTLKYPKYGDGKHDAFDLAMRDYAVTKFNREGRSPEDSAEYVIFSCDIKLETEYFVSAVFCGTIKDPTAPHDMHFAYTVNADTRSGKVYLYEELVGDIELIKSGLSDGKFSQSYGVDGLMDSISNGHVSYEDITQSWRSDYGIFPDMYFTNDSFGIIAELHHAFGGYAGFEIPYADTGDMINHVAKGLAGIDDTEPPESYYHYEIEPQETNPPATEAVSPTTTPAQTTQPTTEPEPEKAPRPAGMIHVTDGDVPYSYVVYDYTYHLSDYARSIMAADPVFTDAESFRSFIDEIYDPDSYFVGSFNHLFEESGYFDDEFFKTHNLYWNQVSEGSGSISVSINSITKSNGGIHITLDRYLPMLQTQDMQTNTFLVAVDKALVQNTNVSYRYDTYSEYYNSDGDTYYYKKAKGIHGVTTYILNEIPEDTDNFFKQTVIMRTTDDMDKFLKNISAVCDGNTDKYFRELPQSYKSTYEIYDLVYLGIFNTSIIYKNGGIKTNLTDSGILEIIVPAPHMEHGNTALANMSIARLPKNVLEDVKGIKVITK